MVHFISTNKKETNLIKNLSFFLIFQNSFIQILRGKNLKKQVKNFQISKLNSSDCKNIFIGSSL